ncbi:ankyrin repeat domain-containing protein [Candidatus Dependentiae bacterium]|nr:ankyrin repeat domain-containing protein [Candidatus Dependentiae bacterium]
MQLRNGIQTLHAYRPTFDPNLDIATVVFSHVQCVKTRHSLALVSKLWRDASKPAAAYPRVFDFDAVYTWRRIDPIMSMMNNDEALSLPYERVVGLLGGAAENVCTYAAMRGSVRLLKWARENNYAWHETMFSSPDMCYYAAGEGYLPLLQYLHENGCPWNSLTCNCAARNGHLPALKYLHENGCPWNMDTCSSAARNGHLPALKYLHENGCPWNSNTCHRAAHYEQWDCLQYAVDNKCEGYLKYYAEWG